MRGIDIQSPRFLASCQLTSQTDGLGDSLDDCIFHNPQLTALQSVERKKIHTETKRVRTPPLMFNMCKEVKIVPGIGLTVWKIDKLHPLQ